MSNSVGHVAIFLPALYGGGAERTMLKLAGGIAARNYHVDLVLGRAKGPYLADIPPKVHMVDLKSSRDLFSLFPLVNYLRKARPAVLLSGLHTNLIALWARQIARVPIRVVLSERTTLSQRVEHYASDLRMRFMPQIVRRFYPWADCIVAVSCGVADDLIQNFKLARERIHVIYNPVVTPDLYDRLQSSPDHPWFKEGEPAVVLAVGRLAPAKDYPTLIKAFAQVRDTHRVRLMILGEGEERPALENLIRYLGLEEHICMPGFVSNPYPYMSRASVFVLSSRWEGLPGVLIEAMYCGAPLVATDCPSGPREILAGGKYGRLVPVADEGALASSIIDALEGKVGSPPDEGWQPFDMNFVVNQYIEVLFGESL